MMSDYLEGVLTLADEDDPNAHLHLQDELLTTGRGIEVLIGGQWIAGGIELGVFGKGDAWFEAWYLHTGASDGPDILLRPGIRARIRA